GFPPERHPRGLGRAGPGNLTLGHRDRRGSRPAPGARELHLFSRVQPGRHYPGFWLGGLHASAVGHGAFGPTPKGPARGRRPALGSRATRGTAVREGEGAVRSGPGRAVGPGPERFAPTGGPACHLAPAGDVRMTGRCFATVT